MWACRSSRSPRVTVLSLSRISRTKKVSIFWRTSAGVMPCWASWARIAASTSLLTLPLSSMLSSRRVATTSHSAVSLPSKPTVRLMANDPILMSGTPVSLALSRALAVLKRCAAEGVRAAVLSGLGYAIASEWMFAPELASGAVLAVLTDWVLPSLDLWALFPTGRMVTAKARAFANFVEAELARPYCARDRA